MRQQIKIQVGILLCLHVMHWIGVGAQDPILTELLGNWRQINEVLKPTNNIQIQSRPTKVVFPIPEDFIKNRSYLPDMGLLTDLAFLFLPANFPASGIARLSRDLFESEQCVQYVSCEMTKVSQRYEPFHWVRNFLQDFPAQGDFVERLKQGSLDAIARLEEKKTTVGDGHKGSKNDTSRTLQNEICTFSCHPIKSLSRGLKILSLLHDLVRTVKF